jgi:hypothetical protein
MPRMRPVLRRRRLLHRVVDASGSAAHDHDRSSTDPWCFGLRRAITKPSPAWSQDGELDWTIAHGAGVFTDGPHTGRRTDHLSGRPPRLSLQPRGLPPVTQSSCTARRW